MFFLIFINFDVHASSPDKPIVDKNKLWSVTFNDNLDYSKLSNDSIIVTDNLGNKENIKIINGPSSNMITVLPPSGGYKDNKDYVLTISKQIYSSKNKQLKEEKRLYFKTKEKSEDTIVFKDPILDANIRDKIYKCDYEPIYKSDVESITDLYLANRNIKDLSGLENLTNLKSIDLSKNEITNISSLSNLTNLENLFLSYNQINDIAPLKSLPNLKILYMDKNQISNIISLKNLTSLHTLSMEYNKIQDLSALQNLKQLQELMLSGNSINDEQKNSLKNSLPNCNIYFN